MDRFVGWVLLTVLVPFCLFLVAMTAALVEEAGRVPERVSVMAKGYRVESVQLFADGEKIVLVRTQADGATTPSQELEKLPVPGPVSVTLVE